MSDERNAMQQLFNNLHRYITLNIDYARLTAAEKVSVLLSTIAFALVLTMMLTLVLIFLSFGIGHLLAKTIAPVWAFMYVAAFYVVLVLLLAIFRRRLFIDPITRFVTKLFVKPPKD